MMYDDEYTEYMLLADGIIPQGIRCDCEEKCREND